jgi:hypothetical protein
MTARSLFHHMLKLTRKPRLLGDFGVLGFDVKSALGAVGTMSVALHPPGPIPGSDFKFFLDLQPILGERVGCEFSSEEWPDDKWEFAGRISDVTYEAGQHYVGVTISDPLADMAQNCASRVFTEVNLSAVLRDLLPKGVPNKLTSGFGDKKIKLAIQYQESDLMFLTRLVNLYGGQLWCQGDTIWAGDPAAGDPIELELGHDITDFSLFSALGPEAIGLRVLPYKSKQATESNVASPAGGFGNIQGRAVDRRSADKRESEFHITLEDSSQIEPDHIAERLLRAESGGRLRIQGHLRKPLSPGALVAVTDAGGNTERLVLRSVLGSWGVNQPLHFRFEACSPEGAIGGKAVRLGLRCSTARIEAASDDMNRVRVIFHWDKDRRVTPWLRMASPYWGEKHTHYSPPIKGDTVLVLFGQEDLDPIVIGALALADRVGEPKETFVFKTADGHTITIGKSDIKVRNEANGGNSAIEVLPKKIVIISDKIEMKATTTEIKTSKLDVV